MNTVVTTYRIIKYLTSIAYSYIVTSYHMYNTSRFTLQHSFSVVFKGVFTLVPTPQVLEN